MPTLQDSSGAHLNEVRNVSVGKDVESGFEPSLPSPFGWEIIKDMGSQV